MIQVWERRLDTCAKIMTTLEKYVLGLLPILGEVFQNHEDQFRGK